MFKITQLQFHKIFVLSLRSTANSCVEEEGRIPIGADTFAGYATTEGHMFKTIDNYLINSRNVPKYNKSKQSYHKSIKIIIAFVISSEDMVTEKKFNISANFI